MLGGLDIFLPYIKDYVKTFMGKSITTQQWKDHLYDYYHQHGGAEKIKLLDSVDWKVGNLYQRRFYSTRFYRLGFMAKVYTFRWTSSMT